jgi:amidase
VGEAPTARSTVKTIERAPFFECGALCGILSPGTPPEAGTSIHRVFSPRARSMHVHRRQFLQVASHGAAAIALAPLLSSKLGATVVVNDPFAHLDAVGQAELITKKKATPVEVLEAAIRRIEALNPKINAVVADDFERARSRARENHFNGPFTGVPFLIKDLDDFAGVRTSFGARAMLQNISTTTEPYVEACVATGINVVGKSNTPELGLTGTTESLALGPCYNPWNLKRSSGGSSGGAGAAVAAGIVPMAQGSDGGGSIRIPASCCGVFGLKPSRGRLKGSNDEFEFSVNGVLSRSVRDSAHMLAHTEREKPFPGYPQIGLVTGPNKRRLKIGMYLKGASGQEPANDVTSAILSTAQLCEELGHEVRVAKLDFSGTQMAEDFLTLWASDPGQTVERFEKERGRKATLQDFEPLTMAFAAQYSGGGKEKVPAAAERLQALSKKVAEQIMPYDVLLSPVLATAPPMIGEQGPTIPFDELLARVLGYVSYTPVFNVAGMPAMSVPLTWNEQGLPIGSQFAAKAGDERTLLELAYELEAARPWASKWAPCSVGA